MFGLILKLRKSALLHETESDEGEEDLLMAYEEPSRYPLVNGLSNHFLKCFNSWFFLFELFCLVNSLEEEGREALQRVLVHVVDNAELNEEEVKH